jgi:hypothetical protein
LYWRSLVASPTRSALVVVAVESIEPPAFAASLDSSTQPSWAATEMRVTTVGGTAGVAEASFEFGPSPTPLVPLTT